MAGRKWTPASVRHQQGDMVGSASSGAHCCQQLFAKVQCCSYQIRLPGCSRICCGFCLFVRVTCKVPKRLVHVKRLQTNIYYYGRPWVMRYSSQRVRKSAMVRGWPQRGPRSCRRPRRQRGRSTPPGTARRPCGSCPPWSGGASAALPARQLGDSDQEHGTWNLTPRLVPTDALPLRKRIAPLQ